MKSLFITGIYLILFSSCSRNKSITDASGSFEADEVIVSSELTGKITSLKLEEGALIPKNAVVGNIDAENIQLQKEQVQASIESLRDKTADVGPQVKLLEGQLSVQQSQLNNLMHEKARIQNLVKADAATGKQLDDINAQIEALRRQMEVTRRQIEVQRNSYRTQNRSILSEKKPLQKKIKQLENQISDAEIINPVNGTVLEQYAEEGEMTAAGKALYKIADLSQLDLRAYITGGQFSQVRLGQKVRVLVDSGDKKYRNYTGTVSWISDKAEFTPKTIQTKDERANLVYAIKIRVKNDGYLKIGMYGEVKFD